MITAFFHAVRGHIESCEQPKLQLALALQINEPLRPVAELLFALWRFAWDVGDIDMLVARRTPPYLNPTRENWCKSELKTRRAPWDGSPLLRSLGRVLIGHGRRRRYCITSWTRNGYTHGLCASSPKVIIHYITATG